ncbi:hypothetical protein ACO1O0_000077 [Amphichorda felina]
MGYPIRHLQPGSLYVTIAIPPLAPYQSLPADFYQPHLLRGFDPTRYETSIPIGRGREEFDWGLYWLHDQHHGKWYTLRPSPGDNSSTSPSPSRVLCTVALRPSAMRLNPSIVGLIRVLSLPATLAAEMPLYLDWLTAHAAPAVTRTFLWAATAYLRCRIHVAHTHVTGAGGGEADGARPFDINVFLREALGFAYGEVWHALVGGQLPRPVMVSALGVELLAVEGVYEGGDNGGCEGKDGEDMMAEV